MPWVKSECRHSKLVQISQIGDYWVLSPDWDIHVTSPKVTELCGRGSYRTLTREGNECCQMLSAIKDTAIAYCIAVVTLLRTAQKPWGTKLEERGSAGLRGIWERISWVIGITIHYIYSWNCQKLKTLLFSFSVYYGCYPFSSCLVY